MLGSKTPKFDTMTPLSQKDLFSLQIHQVGDKIKKTKFESQNLSRFHTVHQSPFYSTTHSQRGQPTIPVKKCFLLKKVASQQTLIAKAPREEDNETPDTFLARSSTPRNLPPIQVGQDQYQFIPQQKAKFQGIQLDADGKVIQRRVLGNQEHYKQGQQRKKEKVLDLRQLKSKLGGFNVRTLQAVNKFKRQVTINSQNSNDQRTSVVDHHSSGKEPSVLQPSKILSMASDTDGPGSPSKARRQMKFVKFNDLQLREAIKQIDYRLDGGGSGFGSLNNSRLTTNPMASTMKQVSTMGALMKEQSQERILVSHQNKKREWTECISRIQKKMLTRQNANGARQRFRSIAGNPSVMERGESYNEKMQELNAIHFLREKQHVNENLHWIFSLRNNDQKALKGEVIQQYIPAKNRDICAVVIPRQNSVGQLHWQHSLDGQADLSQFSCNKNIKNHIQKRMEDLTGTISNQNINIVEVESSCEEELQQEKEDDDKLKPKPVKVVRRNPSQPTFRDWDSFKRVHSKEGEDINQVMNGTTMSQLKELKLHGSNVFVRELDHSLTIPNSQRLFMMNHHVNVHGEGEPSEKEAVIEESYLRVFGF